MKKLRLRSCAKINLGLEILRKRDDGYHDLNSIFIAVDLHDIITMERSNELSFECEPAVTDSPTENLAFKAASLLVGASDKAAKIQVQKYIPSGGGLGGGSSNAATTLLGMSILYPEFGPFLAPYASRLGSDVPFFLNPGVALVQGRGDVITPIAMHVPWIVLLVLPGLHVSTAETYSTLGITGEQQPTDLVQSLSQAVDNQQLMPDLFRNDLETVVFDKHPQLKKIKALLYEQDACFASMSGSGSTMYGLFTSVDNAEHARAAFPDLRTYICRPVDPSYLLL